MIKKYSLIAILLCAAVLTPSNAAAADLYNDGGYEYASALPSTVEPTYTYSEPSFLESYTPSIYEPTYDYEFTYDTPGYSYSTPSYSGGCNGGCGGSSYGSGLSLGCLLGGCGSSSIAPRWTDYSSHYTQPAYRPAPVAVATPASPAVNTNINTNTVTVNVPATPTYAPPVYNPPVYQPVGQCSLAVSGVAVRAGNPLTLTWNAQNVVANGTITNLGSVSPVGSRLIYPYTTTTYVANFTGVNGQSVTCTVTAYVSGAQTPYVTLSQVPYTGLDLSLTEEIAYWGFIIFWCAFAAYLLVVKRTHVHYASKLKEFLFGSSASQVHSLVGHGHSPTSAHTEVKAREDSSSLESPDEFIRAQIAKHTK